MSDSMSTMMVLYLNARKAEVYEKMLARNSNQESFELYREYEEIEERLRRCNKELGTDVSTSDKRKQPQEHGEDGAKSGCKTGGADVIMEDWDAARAQKVPSPKSGTKRRRHA